MQRLFVKHIDTLLAVAAIKLALVICLILATNK